MSPIRKIKEKYSTDYEIGEDNLEILGFDLHNPVFFSATALILVFVVGTIAAPTLAFDWFDSAKQWAINYFDWFFMSGTNILLLLCVGILLSPAGKIRLGGSESTPQFSMVSWLSMLFAAGVGIGLMFWGVAEPVAYFTDWAGTPLNIEPRTPEAAAAAVGSTLFHWGLSAWSIYAIVGLSLAFFAFNMKLPLTLRSCFYPLLGDRVWGTAGNVIDILAVVATVFGLATSLGFGAKQGAAGLHYLFDTPNNVAIQIVVIAVVTSLAIISVVRGLDKGVKVLSNINLALAILLLLFVIFAGLGWNVFQLLWTNTVTYIQLLLPLSSPVDRADQSFYQGWTIFYWAWWISWSPFVGMFIARVSKGRTIREFLTAVLVLPTLFVLVWMTAFGNAGIEQVTDGVGKLANGIEDSSLALFYMLENLPLHQITSFISILLLMIFFVTSSDSGSLVIDNITAGGKLNVPVMQRVFWAVVQGIIAAVLLYGGGDNALSALQAAAITVGLPFTLVLLLIGINLILGLRAELTLLKHGTQLTH